MLFVSKQKTAYERRISDWSSDVCSSDLLAEIPQQARSLGADQCGERVRIEPLAATELAAVAARGTPADPPRLQHDCLVAAFGQVQRRCDSGVAAANDTDVAAMIAPQRRRRLESPGRRCVGIGRASCRERVCQYV